jgi:hypothetical protein
MPKKKPNIIDTEKLIHKSLLFVLSFQITLSHINYNIILTIPKNVPNKRPEKNKVGLINFSPKNANKNPNIQ